jgi:hypothetical protein
MSPIKRIADDDEPEYFARLSAWREGDDKEECAVKAGIEVLTEENMLTLGVMFGGDSTDRWQSVEIALDAKAARNLAYTLLSAANDIGE